MSKQYGLIVPDKDKPKPTVTRPSIFNNDSDDSDTANPTKPPPIGFRQRLKKQDKITQNRALEQDPTCYQYDEVYDEIDRKRKESKLLRKDLDRKPKYINRLLESAERRKKEHERRIERQIQKEREAEGEQYKDKESFVTTAYRKKLEEMKQMEELEKREEYLESIGDVTKQQNLDGFYRHLYQQKVNYDDDSGGGDDDDDNKKNTSDKDEDNKKDNTEEIVKKKQFKQRKYRKRESSHNSDNADEDSSKDEEIEIKKEHLPSNLDADSDFSIDSSDSDDDKNDSEKPTDKSDKITDENLNINQDKKEADTVQQPDDKEIVKKAEEKLAIDVKVEEVVAEPPPIKKPKIDIWKKRTVGDVFEAALQRYFERKALREL